MSLVRLARRVRKKLRKRGRRLVHHLFQWPRVVKYRLLSNCKRVQGGGRRWQPVQICGEGVVTFGRGVHLGAVQSPHCYSGYIYLEARSAASRITVGDQVYLNNNTCIVSDGPGIHIGARTLIGSGCDIFDSDFHDLDPEKRFGGTPATGGVEIGPNAWIGANVKIMKGVRIGENSVIANGSIVTKSIPANVVAAGCPARVVRAL